MTNRLLMADVSSIQGPIDVAAYHRAGFGALAVKATEGVSYINPHYAETVDAAHRLGMAIAHYHFGVAAAGGVAQAKHFLSVIHGHVKTRWDHLGCDVESQPPGYKPWTAPDGARLFAASFGHVMWDQAPRVGLLRKRVRRVFYGPPFFLRDQHVEPARGEGLWVASYGGKAPAFIPPGWSTWRIWQFTDRASIPGIHGPVDESHIRPSVLHRMRAYPTLRPGSKGPAVRLLQHLLNDRLNAGLHITGEYDPATKSAVNRVHALIGNARSGVAGQRVWRYLTTLPKES